jgi:hypothetical protein
LVVVIRRDTPRSKPRVAQPQVRPRVGPPYPSPDREPSPGACSPELRTARQQVPDPIHRSMPWSRWTTPAPLRLIRRSWWQSNECPFHALLRRNSLSLRRPSRHAVSGCRRMNQ